MSAIETWLVEAKAEGKAEGQLAAILNLGAKGLLRVADARAEVADLLAAGVVSREQAQTALNRLG